MYAYELHQVNAAELIRRAEAQRTVRRALVARRAERRPGREDPEGRVTTDQDRFAHAA
ncbi:hypothetical protein OHA98_09085 [Streptomyces sp. NBC_00654]|uniref:hypothetical protein n=1 Tax=Streptomyces sp. NBC_00654 TaxID=2975799 RepID=UPI00225285E3|nr:hypothetical protein [Streptomyces sp. NBC_00654]MCX4964984.1 hypothetical protein [Streptomyces sp. NBC_00654]